MYTSEVMAFQIKYLPKLLLSKILDVENTCMCSFLAGNASKNLHADCFPTWQLFCHEMLLSHIGLFITISEGPSISFPFWQEKLRFLPFHLIVFNWQRFF